MNPLLHRVIQNAFVSMAGLTFLILVSWVAVIAIAERLDAYGGPVSPVCRGQTAREYRTAITAARDQLQGLRAARQIPGLAVAVAVKGRIVWSEGIGYADVEHQTLACPTTQFRTASVAKTFTAAALARLVERGAIELDAPVARYVPSYPNNGARITIAELASHRSGIRAYRDDRENLNTIHYTRVIDSLSAFQDDPLEFTPGSQFLYSSFGYVLLSAAIEGASRKPFLDVVRDEVFAPLTMRDSLAADAGNKTERLAAFYDYVTPYSMDGQIHPSPSNDFSNKWAAAGFVSTVEDLARFGSAHIAATSKGFLQARTLEWLFKPESGVRGVAGYGIGWLTAVDLHLRRVHFHFGAGTGATSVLVVYPDSGVVLAIMSNLGHAKFGFGRLTNIITPFLR